MLRDASGKILRTSPCIRGTCSHLQRFLKALGYLSLTERPPEVDEQIQMHADALYHRMLREEAEIEEAKSSGKPAPSFPPLVDRPLIEPEADVTPENISATLRSRMQQKYKGLSETQRKIEEKALLNELAAAIRLKEDTERIRREQDEQARIRKEKGESTFGDHIQSIFRWS